MKNYVVALAVALCASACVAAPALGTPAPSTSAVPSITPSPTIAVASTPTASTRPAAYRVMSSVPGRATVSPDGKWIIALTRGSGGSGSIFEAIQLFTIDGTPGRDFTDIGVFWGWLPDSSGIFVAPMVPQRAPPLAIVNLDGRVISTELQLSHATLSRDATLVVAEQQEGCCVAIIQREIRVARRDGGGTRTLVTSTVPSEPQTVSLLGVDASDRAVYRDGTKIARVPITGGAATTLATSADYARVIPGNTSPDGNAIVARGYEPARWFVIANDRVTAWDESLGSLVEDGNPGLTKTGAAALWIGPHTLLTRDLGGGALYSVDALTTARTPQAARLLNGDIVLAHQRGTLVVLRGGVVVLLDLATGGARETGLDLRPNTEGTQAFALPSGGFILSSSTTTYRID